MKYAKESIKSEFKHLFKQDLYKYFLHLQNAPACPRPLLKIMWDIINVFIHQYSLYTFLVSLCYHTADLFNYFDTQAGVWYHLLESKVP